MQIDFLGALFPVKPEHVLAASCLFNAGKTDPPAFGFFTTLIQVLLHG